MPTVTGTDTISPPTPSSYRLVPSLLAELAVTYSQRAESMETRLKEFKFVIPRARAPAPEVWCCRPDGDEVRAAARRAAVAMTEWCKRGAALRLAHVRQQLFFPDKRLIQYDCGKLQVRMCVCASGRIRGELAWTHQWPLVVCPPLAVELSISDRICARCNQSSRHQGVAYRSPRWPLDFILMLWDFFEVLQSDLFPRLLSATQKDLNEGFLGPKSLSSSLQAPAAWGSLPVGFSLSLHTTRLPPPPPVPIHLLPCVAPLYRLPVSFQVIDMFLPSSQSLLINCRSSWLPWFPHPTFLHFINNHHHHHPHD